METSISRSVAFGVFEVDVASAELRKRGMKVPLQSQPFQILCMLLERPGEVITRQEMRQRLWPADTFVDFEHSLNSAVKKLRQALGDSSGSPRFVETLARRGYRFIAPVTPDAAVIASSPAPVEPPGPLSLVETAPPAAAADRRLGPGRLAAIAAAAVLAGAAATWLVRGRASADPPALAEL